MDPQTTSQQQVETDDKTDKIDSQLVSLNMSDHKAPVEARRPCVVFRIGGVFMSLGILSLPLVAFLFAVVVSIMKDFDASTATHCRVWNIFPSISAAISCCTPQRYIWRLLIAFHTSPRFMIAVMYYNHYVAFPVRRKPELYKLLVAINSGLHMLENGCLLLLSFVMSHENYGVHEKGFIGFMIFSTFYMILTLVVFRWSRSSTTWVEKDLKSYWWKKALFTFNITTFLVSVYFFFRHNSYCEPGVYSIYAFLEYLVVISNIAFHSTAIYEYGQGELVFSEVPINKLKFR